MGTYMNDGRPTGFTSLTPFIVVDGAAKAIDFYTAVFAATVVNRLDGADGTVGHAELDFGTGRLQLSDPNEGFGLVAPDRSIQGVAQSIVLYVPNVDEVIDRAREHGATIVEEPSDFVSGDRFSALLDPFGRRWSVMTRIEDISPEESERRVTEWFASMGA